MTTVGAGWNTSDGKGISILPHALPVTGKIVLRVPETEEERES